MSRLAEMFDIETGFVLSQKQALEYLKELAGDVWEQATTGETDIEDAKCMLDDLASMARLIYTGDWEWVRFAECPMSASGINIFQVADKE